MNHTTAILALPANPTEELKYYRDKCLRTVFASLVLVILALSLAPPGL